MRIEGDVVGAPIGIHLKQSSAAGRLVDFLCLNCDGIGSRGGVDAAPGGKQVNTTTARIIEAKT